MGPMRLMRAAAPRMAAAGGGRIVNVCSSSGKRPSLTNVAYSVTKAAQLSLSRHFADRWVGEGVLVNAVAPGPVTSPLWLGEGGLADQAAAARGVSRDEALAAQQAKVPLGPLRRAGGDRGGHRLPVLGAREHGRGRGVVGRRRDRAELHLTAPGAGVRARRAAGERRACRASRSRRTRTLPRIVRPVTITVGAAGFAGALSWLVVPSTELTRTSTSTPSGDDDLDAAEDRPDVDRHRRALDVRLAQVEDDRAEHGAPAAVGRHLPDARPAQLAEDRRRDRGRRRELAGCRPRGRALGGRRQVARELRQLAARARARAPPRCGRRAPRTSAVPRRRPVRSRSHVASRSAVGRVDRAGIVVVGGHGRTVRAAVATLAVVAVNTDVVGKAYPPTRVRGRAREGARVRPRRGRDRPAVPRRRRRAGGGPRRRRRAADVRGRLRDAGGRAGDVRPRGRDRLRAARARRAGVRLGAARRRRRRDLDDRERQGRLRAARQRLLRLRVGLAQPARRDGLHRRRGRTSCEAA